MKKIIYLIFVISIVWGCKKETSYRDIIEVKDDGISIAVNESVVTIDNDNTTDISYSEDTQIVSISGNDSLVKENSILVIDLDTAGVIRKVVSIKTINNKTICETEKATMEDVFGDTHFKLSTSMIEPKTSLKNLKTKSEVSKALTDDEGFIHPIKTIYHTTKGITQKSISDDLLDDKFGDNLYTNKDFSGKELYKNSTVNFYISEGYAEFSPVFKFEFDYDKPNIDWVDLEVKKGKLNKFKFWSDETKFDFKTMLTCNVSKQIEIEEVKRLFKNVIKASFKFMVGSVPVYISIDCDIYGKYNLDFSSQMETTLGFQTTNYITLGVLYENDTWSEFHDFRKEDKFYPPQLSGNASLSQRLEIYPHFDVKLYNILGPNLDIIPFIYNENNVDISENWDAHLDLGLDLRVGAEVEILGKDLLSYQSDNIKLYNDTVWKDSDSDNYIMVNNNKYPLNLGYKIWFSELDCGNHDIFAHGLYLTSDITIKKDGDSQSGMSLNPSGKGNIIVFNMFSKFSDLVPGTYKFVDNVNCNGEITDGNNTYTMDPNDKFVTAVKEMNDPTFYTLNTDIDINWDNVDFENPSEDVINKYTNYRNSWIGIKEGSVTIEKSNNNYIITFDCIDNNGSSISGKYNGSLNLIEFAI